MSDEQNKLQRPPPSGPGSGIDMWRAYVAQETGEDISEFQDEVEWPRQKLIELVDSNPLVSGGKHEDGTPSGVRVIPEVDATQLREAPEGVAVVDDPADVEDALGRPTWAVPVAGGYAAENEILDAEDPNSRSKREG